MCDHSKHYRFFQRANDGSDPIRTRTEAEAILVLATEEAEFVMRAGDPFTALDISNALKARNLPVRHGEVAAVIRGLYAGGGMTPYGYDREPISVQTPSGERTQAYLYRSNSQSADAYTRDAQSALPRVSPDRARALDDACPAGFPPSPLARMALAGMVGNAVISGDPTASLQQRTPSLRGKHRRDGAISVPRSLIVRAGWRVGDTLDLVYDAPTRSLLLRPVRGIRSITGVLVRVWADLRVRIARTKFRIAGMAVAGAAFAQAPSFLADAGGLRISPK